MMWGKARKKPIVVEFREPVPKGIVTYEMIQTREGSIVGYPGKDYIIKGVRGELYPIGIDIFNETYDVIEPIQSLKGSANE